MSAAALMDLDAVRRRNAGYLALLMGGVMALLVARLAVLQVSFHGDAAARVRAQETRPGWRAGRALAELPVRAPIFDREGRCLARSWFDHALVVDPTALARRSDRGDDLAAVRFLPAILEDAGVGFDQDDLVRRLLADACALPDGRLVAVRSRVVVRGLDPAQHRLVDEGIDRANLKGFSVRPRLRRTYPFGADAAQVVGLVGESADDPGGRVCGRTGIEHWLDALLGGEPGRLAAGQDALGREFVTDEVLAEAARAGVEVMLTIDTGIQRILHEVLAEHAAKNQPVSASAVVLSVADGEVLGAASWPAPDAEDPAADPARLRLAALQDTFDPGSAIKPLFISWALKEGAVEPDDRFDCGGADGQAAFGPRIVREFSRNPDALDVEGVLIRSSNVGAVRISLGRLGLAGMYRALEGFGIGLSRPLAFPSVARPTYTPFTRYAPTLEALEPRGRLRPEGGSDRCVTWTGISFAQGYEMRLSPLDLGRIYLTIARAGSLPELSLIRELRGPGWVRRAETKAREVLPPPVAGFMQKALLRVVEEERGTGFHARSDRWTLAGKSGTAEVQGRGIARRTLYNAWFCAMAPAHHPEIVVVVLQHRVRHRGHGTYSGGAVSGPAARDLVERVLEYMGVPEDREPDAPEVGR